jgi:hypothetical protein
MSGRKSAATAMRDNSAGHDQPETSRFADIMRIGSLATRVLCVRAPCVEHEGSATNPRRLRGNRRLGLATKREIPATSPLLYFTNCDRFVTQRPNFIVFREKGGGRRSMTLLQTGLGEEAIAVHPAAAGFPFPLLPAGPSGRFVAPHVILLTPLNIIRFMSFFFRAGTL